MEPNALESFACVRRWKSRVSENSFGSYFGNLKAFMQWLVQSGSKFAGYNPDQLIDYQKNCDQKNECYEILDEVQTYVNSLNWAYNSKKIMYSSIRSFFMHQRGAELPRDKGFKIRSDKPPNRPTLTVDDIRQVIQSSNKTYRAVFLSMFQGAMDMERFNEWNSTGWESLNKQLSEGSKIIRIDFNGRKKYRNIKPYFTFIGSDAVESIKTYLPTRPDGATHIFLTQAGKPITKNSVRLYWLRHLDKLGLIDRKANTEGKSKRYGKNLHELRDTFRSLWEKSPSKASVAEHCLGHVGDPLGYEKASSDPDWAQGEYEQALPWLNIISNPTNKLLEKSLDQLREENAELRERIDHQNMKYEQENRMLRERLSRFEEVSERRFEGMAKIQLEMEQLKEEVRKGRETKAIVKVS